MSSSGVLFFESNKNYTYNVYDKDFGFTEAVFLFSVFVNVIKYQ